MAIGPQNGNGNPNAVTVILGNGNKVTEIWLPSGVMNEWINTGIPHTSGRVHILDAAKAGVKSAIVAVTPFDLFSAENKWFYYTSEQLGELLAAFGLDSTRADAYTQGLYI